MIDPRLAKGLIAESLVLARVSMQPHDVLRKQKPEEPQFVAYRHLRDTAMSRLVESLLVSAL